MKKKNSSTTINKVSQELAIQRIKDFRAIVDTKAFFISIDDIKNLYDEISSKGGIGVRAYLAFNTSEMEQELLLVGVVPTADPGCFGTDLTDKIYDLTQPCPNMCDYTSVLYTLGAPKLKLPLRGLGNSVKAKSPVKKKKK